VRNLSGNREQAAAGHADSSGGGSLGRRSVLGGLAALPVLYGVATAGSGEAAVSGARPGSVPTVTDGLAVGVERRYNAPLLTPGTRLVLPKDIKAASVIPERGAPTRVAVLTGFTNGWYDVIHANGRADHVAWDAGTLPVLWIYGEFGATNEAPFHNWIYSLALQPLSRNPYALSTSAR